MVVLLEQLTSQIYKSVRLSIASDMANRLSMLFVVHTQMGGWGDNTECLLLKTTHLSGILWR